MKNRITLYYDTTSTLSTAENMRIEITVGNARVTYTIFIFTNSC